MKEYGINVRVGTSLLTVLAIGQYDNGRRAVQLYSPIPEDEGGDGEAVEPWDTASVNLPEQRLPDNGSEVFFARNYDYHAATFDALVAAGIIEVVPGVVGSVGMHGNCVAARLTPKATANPK